MPGCECCGTPLRKGAVKCYVKGCIIYGRDVRELEAERADLMAALSQIIYKG